MKTIDLSPAMIGRRVTIRRDDLYASGRLNDLAVRTVDDRTITDPGPRMALLGITVMIGGDHIELRWSEELVVCDE